MVTIGSSLPEFKLENQEGEWVESADFAGRPLVVFFYPQASTPTCTVEVCNLRDHFKELEKKGYRLVGISADPVSKQKKFHSKNTLPFDLLSDTSHEVLEAFGVWQQKKTFGREYMGIVRRTFVFDSKGICTHIIEKVRSKEASEQILSLPQ